MVYFLCTCIFNLFDRDEWITIITTLIGLFGSVGIAYWIFSREKFEKKKEEEILSQNELKLLKDSLKGLVGPIDKINEKINESMDDGFYYITTDPDLNANFIKFINLNRIYHSEIRNINLVNKIIQSLSKIETFNDTLDLETKKFAERRFNLDNEYKNILRELELQRIKINNLFPFDGKNATINKVPIEQKFQFELNSLKISLDNNDEIRKMKQLELKKAFLDLFVNKVYKLSEEFSFRESREMGLICLSIISKYDEIFDHEKNYMLFLARCSDFLLKSKNLINSYTN